MDVNPELWDRRLNGAVEATEIPRRDWPPSRTGHFIKRKLLYRWVPPYQLTENLPAWYDLCLLCDVSNEGERRFSPVGKELLDVLPPSEGLRYVAGTPGLAMVASLGGHAILVDRDEIEEDLPLTYDEMRLFFQYVGHLREHLGDTAKLGRVLNVCAGGRADRGTRDILPDDLGLDMDGEGTRWGLSKLREEGLQGASAAGHTNPTPDQILRHGLLAAATRNPLDVRTGETRSLVRMMLFDLGPRAEEVKPKHVTYVARQVKNSLQDHRNDTTEEFREWIRDPKSNLIHRIAKRKDCSLDRRQVRKALLELGWRSLEMLGRCIDMQMRAFRAAFPEPLSGADNALFEQIYLSHPAFGNLPLLLLHSRFDFLREAILRTWDLRQDRRAVAIVHSMMYYYSVIVGNRRASDRRYKRRAKRKTRTGRVSRDEVLSDDTLPPEDSRSPGIFEEAARRLAIAQGFDCDFGDEEWCAKLLGDAERVKRGVVGFSIFCPALKFDETVYVPRKEFESVAKEVVAERKRKACELQTDGQENEEPS